MVVVVGSILIGVLFRPVAAGLKGGVRCGNALRNYASSQLAQSAGRHLLTAAGLAVAIGISAAMGILVASFENTLTAWIKQILKADLYIAGGGAASEENLADISELTWQRIEAMPGVGGADVLKQYRVTIAGKETFLGASVYNDDHERTLQMIWLDSPANGSESNLLRRDGESFPSWISKSFSRRFGVGKGGEIELPTPGRTKPLEVRDVYADCGNEAGMIVVHRSFTREWFSDDGISQMALYLEGNADAEQVAELIRSEFSTLGVRTNARLREDSLRIFHQTFAVTYALEGIAVLIAVSGLGLALAGLLIERKGELSTLKSLRATRWAMSGWLCDYRFFTKTNGMRKARDYTGGFRCLRQLVR